MPTPAAASPKKVSCSDSVQQEVLEIIGHDLFGMLKGNQYYCKHCEILDNEIINLFLIDTTYHFQHFGC